MSLQLDIPSRCDVCGEQSEPGGRLCASCGALLSSSGVTSLEVHLRRRPAGEVPEATVNGLAQALRITRVLALALCATGLDTLERVQAATAAEIASISGITRARAVRITAAARRAAPIPTVAPRDVGGLWECPACACPTAIWSETCLDCGLPFAPEDIPAAGRESLEHLKAEGVASFLITKLLHHLDNAHLWYAHALALDAEGRPREAVASVDAALFRDPTLRRGQLLRLRLLGSIGALPEAARSAYHVLETIEATACRRCLGDVPRAAAACPSCRAPFARTQSGYDETVLPTPVRPLVSVLPHPNARVPQRPQRVLAERSFPTVELEAVRRGLGEPRGLVNGRGRVNGLLDRRGFVNGGRIHTLRLPARTLRVRLGAVGAAAFLAFVTFNLAFGPFGPPTGITVDGTFADWTAKGISPFEDIEPATRSSLNLRFYATHFTMSHLYLRVETDGALFSDADGLDTVHALLDVDADPSTGYRYDGLGADYRMSVAGGSNEAARAGFYRFDGTDREDWNGWRFAETPTWAYSRNGLEIDIPTWTLEGFSPHYMASFLIEGNDEDDRSSSRLQIGQGPAAVEASLAPSATVVLPGTRMATLALRLAGKGEARVETVSLGVEGAASVAIQDLPVVLTEASPTAVLPILVTSTAGAVAGETISVNVTSVEATAPVTLRGNRVAAYVLAAATSKRIDGLFADWAGETLPLPSNPASNPDVDLVASGSSSGPGGTFLYAKVAGELLHGHGLPQVDHLEGRSSPVSPNASGLLPVRRSAEDRLTVFLDVDPGNGTGEAGWIEADWRLEVLGRGGRPTQTRAFAWTGSAWTESAAGMQVAAAGGEIELRLGIPSTPGAEAYLDLRDWRGEGERTSAFATRGSGPTQPLAVNPPSWPLLWRFLGPDDIEFVPDHVEILGTAFESDLEYFYLRVVLREEFPWFDGATYWFYLDLNGDGDNDLLIEEVSGGGYLCLFQWDIVFGWWGVTDPWGFLCDDWASLDDTDVGHGAREVSSCYPGRGCIDFALERVNFGVVTRNAYITAATLDFNDYWMGGDVERNPTDFTPLPCDYWLPSDCTGPIQVPELDLLLPVLPLLLLPGFLGRRRGRPRRLPARGEQK